MKVGVIGAGLWGQNIVRTLNALGALEAIAETSPERRALMTQAYPDLPLYEDYPSLLASDVPAVAIAVPAHLHYGIARDALLAGKDVFVEKPITLTSEEASELVHWAQVRERILMTGHLLLYQPAVRWMKEALQTGLIGELQGLHQERLNFGRARSVENALWNLGVHDVAVALYLVGEQPSKVWATGQAIAQPRVEDDVYLHMQFPNGVQAHLHTSWLWHEKRRQLTLIGADGMLTYDELQQSVTLHRKRILFSEGNLRHEDDDSDVIFRGAAEPLKLEMEHFLQCLSERSQPLSDGASAVAVIRVLEQASQGGEGG